MSAPQPGPRPKKEKSRLRQDGRDMFWSMVPLVVVCILFAGVLGMCSFAPAGPGRAPAPDYDAPAALAADAEALGIPIRLPALPPGWRANSGSRGSIAAGRTVAVPGQPAQRERAVTSTVGYLAPTGMFLALTQSDADEEPLVASLDTGLVPTGVRDVDGVNWVVYEGGDGVRPVWTTAVNGPTGSARLALQGAAAEPEYRTLAAATQGQPPLPRRRP